MSRTAIQTYFKDLGLEGVLKDRLENDPLLLDSMAQKLSEGKSISQELRKILNYSAAYTPLTNDILISQFNLEENTNKEYICNNYREKIIGSPNITKLRVTVSNIKNGLLKPIQNFLKAEKNYNYPAVQILIYNKNTQDTSDLIGLLVLNLKYLDSTFQNIGTTDVFNLTNSITNYAVQEANLNIGSTELSHEGITPGRASAEIFLRVLNAKAKKTTSKIKKQNLSIVGAMVQANINNYINSVISSLADQNDQRRALVEKRKALSEKIKQDQGILTLKTTVKSKTTTKDSSSDGGILKILNISCLIYIKEPSDYNQAMAKLVESPIGTRIFSKAIQKQILKSNQPYISLNTSASYRELVEKKLVDSLEGRSTNYTSATTANITSSTSINSNKAIKRSKKESTKVTGKTKVIKPNGTIRNISGQFTSLPKILTMLQGNINEQVASNMGSPRLNYRKGRFAKSVKINNVTKSDKGLWTITYSYMTYPYQTFEPGYAQGSNARDPRSLITLSIRELVAKEIGNKFKAVRLGGAGSLGRIV